MGKKSCIINQDEFCVRRGSQPNGTWEDRTVFVVALDKLMNGLRRIVRVIDLSQQQQNLTHYELALCILSRFVTNYKHCNALLI